MERVAGIQTGGSERAFDLYMKARYLRRAAPRPRRHLRHRHADLQHDGRDVHDAAVPRPRGAAEAAASSISTPGRPPSARSSTPWRSRPTARRLRPRSRFARFTNLPELQQMFRAFADVQTAEMLDLPRPAAGRRQAASSSPARCRTSRRDLQQELVARYERLRYAEGRSPRGQRPGHHHRRPQARPRRPAALGRRPRISPTRRSTPWSRTSPPSGGTTAATRGTQMIFCDMGVNPTPWGYSRLRRDHRQAGRPRHPARADRRHRRRRLRRQEAGPVREGPATARSAC